MAPKQDDQVKVHYKGTLANGDVFDSSEGREPLDFTVGAGMVIPGFDAAVAGLEVGGNVVVTIPVDQAYGPRLEEMVQTVPLSFFGEEVPEVGMMLQLQSPEGHVLPAVVAARDDESATLDINHPLAGEDLTFDITLVSVNE